MSWHNIEGHDSVVDQFRQAVRRGRLGHAYLFVGPSGVGKRLFAGTLAQALLCEDRSEKDFDPCGQCPGCVQAHAATHPDLITIRRERDEHELAIESVRRAIHDLGFKPDRGRYKIAIVDDADDMSLPAANCFLKSLEEPPPRSVLILIGTSPDRQLATIRSRCQLVRFQPLPAEVIARVLVRTGVVAEPAEAERVARLSGGSLERARGLADPELGRFRAELHRSLAATPINTIALAERMNSLIESAGKESAEKRTRARLLLGMATEFLNECLRASVGAPAAGESGQADALARSFASRRSVEAIAALIERSLDADYQIDRNVSLPLVVEAWVDDVSRSPA